jgi:hypothetical protein
MSTTMTTMGDRATAPTEVVSHAVREPLTFRVWSDKPVYEGDAKPWKCVAAFRFLTECLEYIAECQDMGLAVVFQSPADCRLVQPTERRVVYRPEGGAA